MLSLHISVHGGKKNVIANSNTAVFLSLVSPHWNCRFNVCRNDSNAELLTIPVNLLAVTSGNLSVAFAFWHRIWVGDKPLKGVYKAMMFVDRAVGHGAAKIKSLSLYQLLERRCVYLPQTRTHTHTQTAGTAHEEYVTKPSCLTGQHSLQSSHWLPFNLLLKQWHKFKLIKTISQS